MAVIEKRGELQWRALIRKKGYKTVSITRETKAEVEAAASVIESEMVRGVYVDRAESERTTLSDIIDTFIPEYAEKPENYKQRADKKEAWRFQLKHLKEHLGQYSLANIDKKVIKDYRAERSKVVGDSTIRKEIYMLSKLFSYAEQEEDITLPRGNPITKMSKPGEGRARDRRLLPKEWERLVEQCKRSRNTLLWPAVDLAVETAARQGELLGLLWKDVDLTNQIVILRDTKNGEDRAVPLTNRAVAVLKSLKRPRNQFARVVPVERMTLYHAFVAAATRAKIEDYTFHDIRHEALSRFAERGDLSLLELAEISGHKTLQMLKRYTHLRASTLARKINAPVAGAVQEQPPSA